jgi:hypothetical protein
MPEYDNTNRGALWSNKDNKREGKKDADWTGSINVNGKDYWLNAWRVQSETEKAPVMSLSVRPKEVKSKAKEPEGGSFKKELDDEIPF